MKEVFFIILLSTICFVTSAYSEPIFDIGMAAEKSTNRNKLRFLFQGDIYNPATWRSMIEESGLFTNAKRFYFMDDRGYIVLGETLPEGLLFDPGVGDLIVNRRLVVEGKIFSPTISKIEEHIKKLESTIDTLQARLKQTEKGH